MSNITVAVVSLGCPKNQCDAELMLAKIADAGYTLVSEAGLADVVIINTCCFIQSAKEEAIEEILEAVSRKSDRRAATGKSSMVTSSTVYEPGSDHKIIITGCMAQRYRNDLAAEFPEADGIVGIGHNDDIVQVITDVLRGESAQQVLLSEPERHNMEGARLLSTMPHYAYLRIADGCDNRCSYCAIPLFRGKFRSRAADNIIAEAQSLADKGVKELILIAQDVTNYGADLSQNDNLANLLKRLAQIDKIKWIRLLYCYPQRISDDLIDVIKSNDKVI
ncbi:MAG: radical SAM protein, partial [Oscillospiraceae bacterium]|nr:radical SAM protein [Oscillospiraceae bacterium]